MKKIRIAFVGCGRISDLHHRAYRDTDEAEVTLLCDADADTAERRAAEWGIDSFTTDFEEVISNPDIDAVEILTPQKLHEDMVVRALDSGKHVAVQKPMSIDLPSADSMIRAARNSGRVFKVSENYVGYPPIVEARRLIDEGTIGDPINMRINLLAFGSGGWEIPDSAWEWRMQELLEDRGQEVFDHGHHLWSAAWYLMGGFSEVSAWIDSFQDMVDAPAHVMWKHREGKRYGTCSFSYCNEASIESDYYPNDEWIDIAGSRGIIRISRCTGKLTADPVLSIYRDGSWEHREDIPSDWQLGFTASAANFIRAIQGREAPFPSGPQAREILAMNLAIQASARERRIAYIDELDSRLPALYARRENRHRARAEKKRKAELVRDMRGGRKDGKLGEQARGLTLQLPDRARAGEMQDWDASIGLVLSDKGDADERYTIVVRDGTCRIHEELDESKADLVVKTHRSVWAAVLLGKKKVQTAYIQGKFKMTGDYEYAFKLVGLFGL